MNRLLRQVVSTPPTTPFMLLRRESSPSCELFTGSLRECELLDDLRARSGCAPAREQTIFSVSILPFRQAYERGFEVASDGERILCLDLSDRDTITVEDLSSCLPHHEGFVMEGAFDWTDEEYSRIVSSVVRNEIEAGEGANFVVPRIFHGRIRPFSHAMALSAFNHLIEAEYGAYWTFLLFTGGRYFIGASPEKLLSIANGTVRMNPISGTYRKNGATASEQRNAVLRFLEDEKEIFELFMVVDEELKVMSEICPGGARIVGPFIKEMSKLIHTEYLLEGSSDLDAIAQLRSTMYAATVTGSPIENAFRVTKRYQPRSRRYYGSAVVLLGEQNRMPYLDSAITIRTVEIDSAGHLFAPVGATLVRNSTPAAEVAETHAKLAALLEALSGSRRSSGQVSLQLDRDKAVMKSLSSRNVTLGRFWFETRSETRHLCRSTGLSGCRACIIDNEDRFVSMLAQMLRAIGMVARVTSWQDVRDPRDLDCDVVIVGPGPGDPSNRRTPRNEATYRIVLDLLEHRHPMLAVCLGHQILCAILGFSLARKSCVAQGRQAVVDLFGTSRTVGFYNTFAASGELHDSHIRIARETDSGDIAALRGPSFVSFQFHAESILTQDGPEILSEALQPLCGARR